MNLREIVNTAQGLTVDVEKPAQALKVRDDVVIRRPVGFSGKTHEIIVGKILAFGSDKKTATVSIPGPGGVISRSNVSVSQLQPVTESFKRKSVQYNSQFKRFV